MSGPALEVTDLVKHFDASARMGRNRGAVRAVDGVSFSIASGEVLGLVGESGSGKSTVANCVMRLVEPTAGRIALAGRDITHLSRRAMRPLRREMHMVFQDPFSSLNPRMTAGQIVEEPLRLHRVASGRELEGRVSDLFDRVGLRAELRHRYPHELSGGQRQRVGIARSLSLRPSLLIADEPISALDVSVQAAVLNLLRDIQEEMGFACLFITHDLSTVEYFCDRVAVMYLGKIVESGSRADVFGDPKHPYTQALLSAAVVPDPVAQRRRKRVVLTGDIPSPLDPPSGCRFRTRCPLAERSAPRSTEEEPELRDAGGGHLVACHLVTGTGEPPRLVDVPAAEPG